MLRAPAWKSAQSLRITPRASPLARWGPRQSAAPNSCLILRLAMRILQVRSARDWGGGETHVLELVESLRKHGHDVVLAGRADGPLKPDVALPFMNSADFITAGRLRSRLKKCAFDVVHAHVARDYTIV